MKIKLLSFGYAADVMGTRSIDLEFQDKTSTAELKKYIGEKYPELNRWMKYSIAVNESYIEDDVILKNNDVVAIIPPVSGG